MSELTVTLRQPAQIGDKARSDFVLGTRYYVPGTVVRGAFAAAWITGHGAPAHGAAGRQEFLRLFEGGVRFGALMADGTDTSPLSVLTHKYPREASCPDTEFDQALSEDSPLRCPHCGSPFEQRRGLRGTPVQAHRRTSVAITSSGVAARGQLVTRDTLAGGQSFRGTVTAADPALLGVLGSIGQIRVGGRRTTHGAASVRIRGGGAPPTAQRRDDGCLVLRLRAPGIFTDDHGRPSRDPNPGELSGVLGCAVRVTRRWTRWQAVGGWHVASGLPKPAELAVAEGSTYLLEPSGTVSDTALAALGERGLGLRRHEGFGDLAPPPVLVPGRAALAAESRRRQGLADRVAPLRYLQATRAESWLPLLDRLDAHAAGDARATAFLRGMARQLDEPTARALTAFLGLDPPDAAHVAAELRK